MTVPMRVLAFGRLAIEFEGKKEMKLRVNVSRSCQIRQIPAPSGLVQFIK